MSSVGKATFGGLAYLSLTLFFVFSTISTASGQGSNQQIITLFPNNNCSGNNTLTFTNSNSIVRGNSSLIYSSVKVNGLWQFKVNYPTNNSMPYLTAITDIGGVKCQAILITSNYSSIDLIKFGDDNQTSQSLNLYPQAALQGVSVVIGSNGTNFTSIRQFGSLFYAGKNEWTLYESGNRTGKQTCLKPSQAVLNNGYGFTLLAQSNLTVGSVQFGCNGATGVTIGTFVALLTSLLLISSRVAFN